MAPKELTWDQTLRFRLLEIVLQWEGRLTTNHLMTAFNIGRQQASRDINHYLTHYAPDGLVYDKSLKGYKPTDHFVPRFSEGNVDEYLMLLHREKQHQRQHEAGLLTLPLMDLRSVQQCADVLLAAPGSLPNDGKVIEDARSYS